MTSSSGKYYYDDEAGERPIDFISEVCTHVKGELAGQPMIPLDWVQDQFYRPFYGVKQKENGYRRYKTAYIQVGRKNNKTTEIACANIYNLFGFDIMGYEGHILASSRDQASIMFNEIIKPMIEANEMLRNASEVYSRHIIRPSTRGKIKVHASDGPKLHGLNSDTVSIDEVWALMTVKEVEAITALTTSTASKFEPMTFIIGTPGYDRSTRAYKMYEYAKAVLEGRIIDDTFLPVIHEASEDDDPFIESTWKKANPGYGHTVKKHYLEEKANTAKQYPSELNDFKRLHLGIWTKSLTVWIPAHVWSNGQTNEQPTLDQYKGRQCFIGVDLANTEDLLAVSLVFPNDDGKSIDVLMYYWCTSKKADERKARNEADYYTWQRQGYLFIEPGNSNDYDLPESKIIEVASSCIVPVVAMDKWNSQNFVNSLTNAGAVVNQWPANDAKLWNAPTKKIATMAQDGLIRHFNNPILAWNVENVSLRQSGEYVMPSKANSKDKIDGLVALDMAVGEWQNFIHQPSPTNGGIGL